MNAPHVLIVSSGNPSRNPRPVKEASALSQAGFRVTLLTGGDPARLPVDSSTLAGTACHHQFVPDSRSLPARARRWLACRAVRLDFETVHALGPFAPLMRQAAAISADLTIVHNELPHAIGAQLSQQGRRVAADFEDWYSEDLLPSDRRHRPLRLLRRNEGYLLTHVQYCTTTSQALANALHERYGGRKPNVITNAFPLQPPTTRSTPATPPSYFWFSQTIGPGRGLERFLAAWVLTRNPSQLVLLGEISTDYKTSLCAKLPESFRSCVTFLPVVPPSELPLVIAGHDIGLALEDASIRNRDLTITNKILHYLNAGLAIVASNTAGQREVLAAAPDAGIIVDTHDTVALAAALDRQLADRAALARSQIAARRLAETTCCWEHEAPKFLSLVRQALAS